MPHEHPLRRWLETYRGTSQPIVSITRLQGGTKKGVFRAVLRDMSVILYVWHESEGYWYGERSDATGPFADASGADLFTAAYGCLQSLGVRIPELLHLDTSRAPLSADIAVVEDIPGGTLQDYWHQCPDEAARSTAELGDMLHVLHACQDSRVGKLADIDDSPPGSVRCEQLALARALDDLAYAAVHIDRLKEPHAELEELLRSMADGVSPRSEHSLIHGELGPDHVLVDERGHPVLIDFEGLMFFDVEWEHAFLRFRFDEHYRHLQEEGLDEARLRFYKLCLHLSLCSGPLCLLDGGFPDRDLMHDIITWNTSQALAFRA